MMRIISIANQKGGCGKTITAINLSASLAKKNRRVLLIDMDPQGHATIGLNISGENLEKSMYEVLSKEASLNDIIINVSENLDVAPSNVLLSAIEQKLAGIEGRERRLKDCIENIGEHGYHYIIIDCPPSIGLLTFNALAACSEVIIPIEGSFFSLHGLGKLIETIDIVKQRLGHDISIKALATIFDRRTRLGREVLDEIREHFRENCFNTVIHDTVKLREAASFGKPIAEYCSYCTGNKDYMALADEVIFVEAKLEAAKIEKAMEKIISPQIVEDGVLFAYLNPEAENVRLAGEFNNWNPDDIFMKKEEGIWKKKLSLAPGTYQYRFVVDGQWKSDPKNPLKVQDPFGGYNSVFEVK